jgi:release factor glutamine methyltransferase
MTQVFADRSVRALLRQGLALLRDAQVPSYVLAAELLLLHVVERDRTWIYTYPDEMLPEDTARKFLALVARRAAGEPTQHLTGRQEFWGLPFRVSPDVLIPRPETEHLVEVALDRLAVRERRAGRPGQLAGENLTIVDVGTGSGCIAMALGKELPRATIYATDISPAALKIAQENAANLGFAERIRFIESNLFEKLSPPDCCLRFDVVVCNPPYVSRRDAHSLSIEVRDHEPAIALYGGEEGYEFYSPLVYQAGQHLEPGGLLVVELGYDSLPAVQPLLDSDGWAGVGVTHDLAGIPRVLSAERRRHSIEKSS